MDSEFFQTYEEILRFALRCCPAVIVFPVISLTFRFLCSLVQRSVTEVKVSEEDALYLDIATSISDGSYNMDESVERWADFYIKQQESKM